jgi:hypothetical protein
MNKHVLAAVVRLNKTITFGRIKSSSVKNADRPEREAEVVSIKDSILQESRVLGRAFLRFGILLWSDS